MSALDGFSPVVDLMHRIKDSGNEWPKVRLSIGDDQPLVLSVAGARARNPGAINMTDGRAYGDNVFFGKITVEGTFQPSQASRTLDHAVKASMWALMSRMRDGEAEAVFAEFGKRFGVCAICGRELTNEDSVARGIGPVCYSRAF